MAADLFAITVDAGPVLKMLDEFGDQAERLLKDAAKETAENVRREALGRVSRATGRTARGIVVEESDDGTGYVVISRREPRGGVPHFLEHGTTHMTARPFFDASADLEVGPHLRRVDSALGDAIKKAEG